MSITKASLIDLNGQELILDADADTSITADTDDQIDIKIAGSDSIRIKANEIENVSGDFTLDIVGNISLDADDSGQVRFKDGGTEYLSIYQSSNDAIIQSTIQDEDIIFKGNDGGSTVTALTLDISDGGTATFNSHVRLGDSKTLSLGAGFDIEITSDGTNGTIATPNGTLTVDSSSDIILDADSASIKLKDGGTQFGSLGSSAGLFVAGTACGIRLHSGGTKIFPTDSAGSAADGTVDLGAVGGAWKDLHLSGDVKIANGQGIDFSATSDSSGSMSSELLDDYEEGTWTPVIVGSHSQSGQSYSTQTGTYTKVGRQVTCRFQVVLTAEGTFGVSYLLLSGFPFALASTPHTIMMGNLYFTSMGDNFISIGLQGYQGQSQAYLWGMKAAATNRDYVAVTDLTDSTQLTGTFTYFV